MSPTALYGRRKRRNKSSKTSGRDNYEGQADEPKHSALQEQTTHKAKSIPQRVMKEEETPREKAEIDAALLRILKVLSLNSPDDCLRVGALLRQRGLYSDCVRFYDSLERHVQSLQRTESYHVAQKVSVLMKTRILIIIFLRNLLLVFLLFTDRHGHH